MIQVPARVLTIGQRLSAWVGRVARSCSAHPIGGSTVGRLGTASVQVFGQFAAAERGHLLLRDHLRAVIGGIQLT